MIKKVLPILLLASACYAEQLGLASFKYINTNEQSTIIDAPEAQDLLNVDITPGGKSIKKRPGYGLYKQVFTPSIGIHGGFHGYDTTGNDIQVWESSISVKAILADGTPATIVSSATLNATLDCADTQGSMYCVNSARDFYIRTNGASLTSWQTSPLGTMIESTPDRIAVAGVAASPSTIFFSGSNAFTTYTVGPLSTDPFNEVIAAPGSHLTHIRWGCQKLLWWKEQSFGYFDFDDQYSAQVSIVSDNIGTFDNTSAVDPGGTVWFRGQDGHIYSYDCSGLLKQTIEITPFVQGSGRRTLNSWAQSSQADWQTGLSSPTASLSTTINVGSVTPSTFTRTENSSASGWASGTASNVTVGVSSISLATNNSGNVDNNSFETQGNGVIRASSWTLVVNAAPLNYLARVNTLTYAGPGCTITTPKDGSFAIETQHVGSTGVTDSVSLLDINNNILATASIDVNTDHCTAWNSFTLSSLGNIGKLAHIKFSSSDILEGTATLTQTNPFILGGDITVWYTNDENGAAKTAHWDYVQFGSSTINTGSFASQVFNTGMPYSFVYASATWTVNTATPSFVLQKSANGTTGWSDVSTSTGVNVQTNQPYLRYLSTITLTGIGDSFSSLQGVSLLAVSSGTYFSAVENAPNLTTWSTFNPNWTDNGDDVNFFIRSSANSFTILSSTPAWVTLTPNALISASTGTYFQVIASFTVTAATNTPSSLEDFSAYWFEGSASDQAYMLYFDNAIWASVAYGVGVSSNNYVFKRDLINDGWTLYNFGTGGMLVQNNRLFFGSVPDGNVFQYGSGNNDNGSAINAYWKSKDFTGSDPFIQSALTQIDVFAKQNTGQSVTSTYTMDTSTSTAYTVSLSLPSQTYIQNRKSLPAGKNGYTFNLKFSDNSTTSAWEIFGFRITYNPLPWRPTQ